MEQLIDTVERVHISLGPDFNGGISGRKACAHWTPNTEFLARQSFKTDPME